MKYLALCSGQEVPQPDMESPRKSVVEGLGSNQKSGLGSAMAGEMGFFLGIVQWTLLQ